VSRLGAAPTIPLVDLRAQYRSIADEIDDAIRRVVDSQRFILGPEVEQFEQAFASFVGTPSAVGVASGTAALHLSLVACGIGQGDEVITTAHTFMATGEAISHAGATPVLVDIDPRTFTIDPERVDAAVTPRTRAIVPVHLYGHPADMGRLMEIADRRGLRVIEDAAQAHGATWNGEAVGTIGDLAAFSFFPGKNLGAYGDAGAVTGKSQDLLDKVRKLRDHGRASKYVHDEIGYGERMDALQAAILSVKLRHLGDWTESRRRIAARYSAGLAGTNLRLPVEADWARHVYHLYVVRARRRDELQADLQAAGIGAGVHYPVPLHRQPAYASLSAASLPHTDAAAAEVLSLPMYPEMTDDDVDFVIGQVAARTKQ
jgi:dTDP-4-amino-4,6-dideoxygalactose transaminase